MSELRRRSTNNEHLDGVRHSIRCVKNETSTGQTDDGYPHCMWTSEPEGVHTVRGRSNIGFADERRWLG